MNIHFPSHCAHANDCSRGAPGKRALTFSVASTTKGVCLVEVSAPYAWKTPQVRQKTTARGWFGVMVCPYRKMFVRTQDTDAGLDEATDEEPSRRRQMAMRCSSL